MIINCDGACEPKNPGGHGVGGWVIKTDDGTPMGGGALDLGQAPSMTNNIAEYGAVKGALLELVNWPKGTPTGTASLRTDSKLVVEQLNDRWACRSPHLRKMRDEIWVLIEQLHNSGLEVLVSWVPREQNHDADEMSRSLYTMEALAARQAQKRK